MIELGDELTEEKYAEIVSRSLLSAISLNEIMGIAASIDDFWNVTGAYYKMRGGFPMIIIDREQRGGGAISGELVLSVIGTRLVSNNRNFHELIYSLIMNKMQGCRLLEEEEYSADN